MNENQWNTRNSRDSVEESTPEAIEEAVEEQEPTTELTAQINQFVTNISFNYGTTMKHKKQ